MVATPRLRLLEDAARTYAAERTELAAQLLGLGAVEAVRASAAWITTGLGRTNPAAAKLVRPGATLLTLQFEIANDGNVLDVTFFGDQPIDVEYH